jgi:uncharacterized protein YjiK
MHITPAQSDDTERRVLTQGSILYKYDFHEKEPLQIELPKKLREISGLALCSDGMLLAHDDERGIVYKINPENGEVLKRFYFGLLVKKADFEGIARADSFVYLITSKGQLIRMSEGNDMESVDYQVLHTGLSGKYNVEGLCYDPETSALLLLCKDYPGKNLDDYRAIYSFSLKDNQLEKVPRFLIEKDYVQDSLDISSFKPSAIERVPQTGSFIIIAAQGNVILELSKNGQILGMFKLNKKWHRQPEGITITNNLNLIISDEGRKRGTISIYKPIR